MTQPRLYQAFAAYNRAMNDKVYALCAGIPDEERKRDRGAFFKSMHGTLNHLLFGDRAWMNRLAERDYDVKDIGIDLFDDFAALRAARVELDGDICAWVEGLTDAWLATEVTWMSVVDEQERRQPRWLLVSHMFNHQTHHRGQLTTLLTQCGYDVGVTDLTRVVA